MVNECCFGNPRQCWILDSTPWIPDYSYWIPDFIRLSDPGFLDLYSRFQRPGFQISFVCWLPDFLIFIPDSKGQDFIFHSKNLLDSGFQGQKFPGFGNPDSLIWVRCYWSPPCVSAVVWFLKKLQGEKL